MTEVLTTPHETTKLKTAPVTKEDFLHTHNTLTTTPEGKRIGARQDQERAAIENRYACEKDAVHCGTKEKLSIERMITEAQTMLYTSLGIDPKLEQNSTLLKFTKGGIDTIIMDNIELVKGILEHGVEQFLAVFRAMFSVEGIRRMLRETGQSFMDLFTGDAYATGKAFGTIGMGMFGMVKGAVKAEMKHVLKEVIKKEESATIRSLRALAEKENPIPPAIGDLQKDFNRPSFKPIDGLHTLENLNKHINLRELIGNFRGIEEFTKTVEKISVYIIENRAIIGPKLAKDMFQEIKKFRKNVSEILEGGNFDPLDIQPLKIALGKDIDKALVSLQPQLFQPIK